MQLFIRVRGRVLGPFDEQKLSSLVSRGQFGKMHEVSEDGVTWNRASQYPDLFRGGDNAVVVAEATNPNDQRQEPADYHVTVPAAQQNPPSSTALGAWHYSAHGQEHGPIGLLNLQAMLQTGQLPPSSLVWTNGMSQWLPASSVDGLFASPLSTSTVSGQLSQGVVLQLSEARPWIVFFAVLSTLATIGSLVGGVLFLIQAAKASDASKSLASLLAGRSVGCFLEGILACVTTIMLFSFSGLVRTFTYDRTEQALEPALRKGKQLLVFWGVLAIVAIVLTLIATVYVLAVS